MTDVPTAASSRAPYFWSFLTAFHTRRCVVFESNFTIIVNWKARGFGCAKVCTYCNWRDSALLPHGGQSPESIAAFIGHCTKSFITISGGGDPLYRFDEHGAQLQGMIATVSRNGFRVRVITREVQHVTQLRGIADCVSVSLDADVMAAIPVHSHTWEGIEIEYSLVLPPLPTAEIVQLRPQCASLHRRLGARLVLRDRAGTGDRGRHHAGSDASASKGGAVL